MANKKLKEILLLKAKEGKSRFATIILDCNRFKIINDSLGRQAGDKLLTMVSERLKSKVIGSSIHLTHFGEDKFAILLENIESEHCAMPARGRGICPLDQGIEKRSLAPNGDAGSSLISAHSSYAIALAQKIQQCLGAAFVFEARDIFMSFNMGIVVDDFSYSQPDEIFRDADLAIQKAKTSSGYYYQVFNSTIQNNTLAILELETDLRIALKRQEFYLNYQPIICFQSEKIVGFETLVR